MFRHFSSNVDELKRIRDAMELWIDSFDMFCTSTAVIGHSFSDFFNHNQNHNHSRSAPNSSSSQEVTLRNNAQNEIFAAVSAEFGHIGSHINQAVKPTLKEVPINNSGNFMKFIIVFSQSFCFPSHRTMP